MLLFLAPPPLEKCRGGLVVPAGVGWSLEVRGFGVEV